MNAAAYLLEVGDPEKAAIESADGSITYDRLRDRVARGAAAWRALGLGEGDRVLVLAPDSISWVVAYLSAIWAGGVAVGLNSRLPERDLSVIVAESGARFAWCSPDTVALFERCVCAAGSGPELVSERQFETLVDRQSPVSAAERDADDPAFWIYTSGTTGLPKGVIHAQRCVGRDGHRGRGDRSRPGGPLLLLVEAVLRLRPREQHVRRAAQRRDRDPGS